MEPRFESNTKRKPLLVLNNCKYTHYRKNKYEVSYWRCVHYYKGCRAQIKMYNDKIVNNSTPIHNHGLASSATTSHALPISTTTPKAESNLDRKIAFLQKLLNTKSANRKAFNRKSSKDSPNKDESDSSKHSSNEEESDSDKHSSNKEESDSDKQPSSKKDRPHLYDRSYKKNKKPMKWVKY